MRLAFDVRCPWEESYPMSMSYSRTVLLVDDHSAPRQELQEILRKSGYAVVGESRSTDDALEKLERLRPDAVIIDITLPGTIDPLVAIRQMTRSAPETTILVTGTASQGPVLMEALTMGAVDFFMKPYQLRTIQNCLQRNMG